MRMSQIIANQAADNEDVLDQNPASGSTNSGQQQSAYFQNPASATSTSSGQQQSADFGEHRFGVGVLLDIPLTNNGYETLEVVPGSNLLMSRPREEPEPKQEIPKPKKWWKKKK